MIFDQKMLKKALGHSKSIKGANVLFLAEDGRIEISGDSLYLIISESGLLAGEAKDIPISESMAKLIEAMEPCEMSIELGENSAVIRQGKTRAKFSLAPNARYSLPPIQDAADYTVSGRTLRELVSRVRYAVSTLDSRIALTGIRLFAKGDVLAAEGLDGYQAAQAKTKKNGGGADFDMILPMPACVKLLELLGDDENVRLASNGQRAEFAGGGWTFRCALIAAPTIQVDKIITDAGETGTMVKFEASEILAALNRAKIIMGGSARLIKLHIASESMRITANGHESDFEDEIREKRGETPANLDMLIGLNADYLSNMTQACKADVLNIRVNGEVSPLIAYAEDEETGISFRAVALPVRVKNG